MDLGWQEAIQKVLSEAKEPLHYKVIAEEIEKSGLRKNLGATPANTVNSAINTSIKSEVSSPFVRVGKGLYALGRKIVESKSKNLEMGDLEDAPTGLIQCLGMYWLRSNIVWTTSASLLGQQQINAKSVNFCKQVGIYILYDRERVIYVGRTTERPMGQRLYEHTRDRLNARWDRFSWFGLKSVGEDGELSDVKLASNNFEIVISTLEAILIAALEPPQNRKRGDQFSVSEYLQVADPELAKREEDRLIGALSKKLSNRS